MASGECETSCLIVFNSHRLKCCKVDGLPHNAPCSLCANIFLFFTLTFKDTESKAKVKAKDLTLMVKAKDLITEAKAEDLSLKAKAKAKDMPYGP